MLDVDGKEGWMGFTFNIIFHFRDYTLVQFIFFFSFSHIYNHAYIIYILYNDAFI